MVPDPMLYTAGPFMTSTRYAVNRRLGRKLILRDVEKKGGVLSATLMLKGLKGTNVIEITWHVKSVTLSFAYALNTPRCYHLGIKGSFSL